MVDDSILLRLTTNSPRLSIRETSTLPAIHREIMQTVHRLCGDGQMDVGAFDEGTECRICLFRIEEAITTVCHHTFCRLCLRTWLRDNDTCPICRRDLSKAPGFHFVVGNRIARLSNETSDQPSIHAGITLEQSVSREGIQLPPPVLNTPPAQIMRVSNVPTSASSDSQGHTFDHPLRGSTSADSHSLGNENRDGDQLPTTSLSPVASQQISTSRLPRASYDHDPTEHRLPSRHEFDIGHHDANELAIDGLDGQGSSITIDPQLLLVAMRSTANEVAHTRGISQCPDYSQAAKVVYRQWVRLLKRKAGQTVHKYDLMWLLAEEANLALADAGFDHFNRGEVLPQRLSRYLCDIARAAVDA